MRRRDFLAAIAVASSAPRAFAQTSPPRRLAIVSLSEERARMREGGLSRYYDVLMSELRRVGHIEGTNLQVDRYSIERRPEGVQTIVAEVVKSNPDVIYAVGFEAVALKRATATIPIVALSGDPIASGLVTSLSRPGGNVTGVSVDTGPSIHGKRIALLREFLPSISRIAFITSRPAWEAFVGPAALEAATIAGIQLLPALLEPPATDEQYRDLLNKAVSAGADAVIVSDSPDALARRVMIAEAVASTGLPAMYAFKESVEAGGLIAYSFDLVDLNRRAASAIDAILRGTPAGEIPYYQNRNFQLFINQRTAQALGRTVPPALVARADDVIE